MYRGFINAVLCTVAFALPFTAGAQGARSDAPSNAKPVKSQSIERGKYLTIIAGCNDCHTPGYAPSAGKIDEKEWLTGGGLGWRGPWGTTYPGNLRLFMQTMSETSWVQYTRTTQLRPPMPWFTLRDMADADLRAIYRFVRYLGPSGKPAPAYVPPGVTPQGPYAQFPEPPK